jgi:hypothetical protein
MAAFQLVPRRYCNATGCRQAGRAYHRAHSPCEKTNCLDRGLSHESDHRVATDAASAMPGAPAEVAPKAGIERERGGSRR